MDKTKKIDIVLRIIESLAFIVALFFSMRLFKLISCGYENTYLAVFCINTFAFALSALNAKKKNNIAFLKFVSAVVIYLIMTSILLVFRNVENIITYILFVYGILIIISRIVLIVKKHSFESSISDILIILLWIGLFVKLLLNYEVLDIYASLYFCIAVPAQILFRITCLSFSKFRFDILFKVMKKSMVFEILSGLAVLIMCFSFAFTYLEESMTEYSDALWYCFAIVTTIGFGDITATSDVGRILSVILGIYGLIVVALITSIIVNFYNELNKEKLSLEGEKDSEKSKME